MQPLRRVAGQVQSLRGAGFDSGERARKKPGTRCAVRLLMETLPSHRSTPPDDLRQLFTHDHERLDRLFRDLLAAFEADARVEAGKLWNEFDTDLRAHMQLEEELLLPRFAEAHGAEALALIREHEQSREKLLQLGVGVDLHVTRFGQVEDFVRLLRAHAKREEELMYRWAARRLQGADQPRGLVARIAQRMRHEPTEQV